MVLQFSYNTLMTFLMMLSVILVSMLMILPFTVSVTWHLIFDRSYNTGAIVMKMDGSLPEEK